MVDLDPDHLLRLRGLIGRHPKPPSVTALPGGFVTRARGQGLETADLRVFTDGDDPRHIDRNATARSGRLQVRTFQAERDRTMLLMADFRPSMLWGTRRTLRSIAAAETLALAGWRAVTDGGRVGLLAFSAGSPVYLAPKARDRAMVAIAGALARAHADALTHARAMDPPLSDALDIARRLAPRGAEIVLATGLDTLGAGFGEAYQALSHRCRVSLVRVLDAFESDALPAAYRFCTASGQVGTAALRQDAVEGIADEIAEDLPEFAIAHVVHAALAPDQQFAGV